MKKYLYLVYLYGGDILSSPGMEQSKTYLQHGSTSIYLHAISVALVCIWMVRKLSLHVNERALVRGALLHDYFLYDWHEKDNSHRWHGFTHPKKATENAKRDFQIDEIEEDMIRCHMFPLTWKTPTYTESWVLCTADKICSMREIFAGKRRIK